MSDDKKNPQQISTTQQTSTPQQTTGTVSFFQPQTPPHSPQTPPHSHQTLEQRYKANERATFYKRRVEKRKPVTAVMKPTHRPPSP